MEQPPRIVHRFFRWFCHPKLMKYIEGDLMELYAERVDTIGKRKADIRFIIDVIFLFRPGIIGFQSNHSSINQLTMIQSYLKTGWRNLLRQKTYSIIKVGGFAMGIAACILIALLIRDELSYDSLYPNGDRIYRIVGVMDDNGHVEKGVHLQPPFASALLQDFPEIEKAGRYNNVELFGAANAAIRRADQLENTYEDNITYIDHELLTMLGFPFVSGEPKTALASPYSIVITRHKAEKYFPGEDPIGKQLIINDDKEHPYTVAGVLSDISGKSHLNFDFMLTLTGKEFWKDEQTDWCCSNYPTYIMLKEGTDAAALEKKLSAKVLEKYILPRLIKQGRPDAEELVSKLRLELQPISDVHLHSQGIHDGLSHGDIRFVWMFGAVGAFVLIIACINFINLSTAKSANRSREVGLRKVVGSRRMDLIGQFMVESILYSIISFLLGVMLASMLLPYFNEMAGKQLSFPWTAWWVTPLMIVASLLIGLVAGLYPSFYMSAFKPAQVLKGSISRGARSSSMRATLVVCQFTISIVLIVGTFVIYRQMEFILNKKLGFNKDNVLVIEGTHMLGDKVSLFKERLLELRQIKGVSVGDYLPVQGTKRNGNQFFVAGQEKTDKPVPGQFWRADEDYLSVMEMKLVAGRNFNREIESDKEAVIINEEMAKQLGIKNPVGARITNGEVRTVIGVVEDFHFESLKAKVEPVAIALGNSPTIVSARLNTDSASDVIKSVGAVWKEMAPNQPIRYTFLNQSYARMYDDVRRMGQVFTSCAAFAIIVACLGLFGLSAFITEQRSKEISIRLVLGASMKNILQLVMQNFVALVLLSFLIASPIAWYLMRAWLEDYSYRIEITWDMFAVAGIMCLLIAILTISYQSIRAALINPVRNLKSE
jgi:putative ABC transport system permease protein